MSFFVLLCLLSCLVLVLSLPPRFVVPSFLFLSSRLFLLLAISVPRITQAPMINLTIISLFSPHHLNLTSSHLSSEPNHLSHLSRHLTQSHNHNHHHFNHSIPPAPDPRQLGPTLGGLMALVDDLSFLCFPTLNATRGDWYTHR